MTIVKYTLEELRKMKGESDWQKIDATTDQEILDQVADDPDLVVPTEQELAEFKLANKVIRVRKDKNEK